MRIIGIELRLKTFHVRFGQQTFEFAVVPCDVKVEAANQQQLFEIDHAYLNGTLHTDCGDVQIPEFDLYKGLLDRRPAILNTKQEL